MKRIILVLLLIAGFNQLKAQQTLQQRQPDLKLSNGLKNYFKPDNTFPSPQTLLSQTKSDDALKILKLADAKKGEIVYSRMPVVKLSGVDHMPIVAPDEKGVKYTMLVKKITVIDPAQQAPAPAP